MACLEHLDRSSAGDLFQVRDKSWDKLLASFSRKMLIDENGVTSSIYFGNLIPIQEFGRVRGSLRHRSDFKPVVRVQENHVGSC